MRLVTIEEVIKAVAGYFEIPADAITDPSNRTTRITNARHIAQYLARKYSYRAFEDIAEAFGQTGHRSPWAAFNKISTEIASGNNHLHNVVTDITAALAKEPVKQ